MKVYNVVAAVILCAGNAVAQPGSKFSLRATGLQYPSTLLLTVEAAVYKSFSFQLETNFTNTHGVNIKYWVKTPLNNAYLFAGNAWVINRELREDLRFAYLTYTGVGYAHRWRRNWVLDSRFGLGPLWNSDSRGVFPVIKIGVGKSW